MKVILYLFLIINLSCSPDTFSDSKNLKNYFWNPTDFVSTRVFEFQNITGNEIRKKYFIVTSKNDRRIYIEVFDENFQLKESLIDVFNDSTAWLESYKMYNNEGNYSEAKLTSGIIFSFNSEIFEDSLKMSFRTIEDSNTLIESTEQFTEFSYEVLDNLDTVLIKSGYSMRTITDLSTSIPVEQAIPIECTYLKGFGLISSKLNFGFTNMEDRFVKEISLSEFQRLKNGS